MKSFQKDKLTVKIMPNREEMGKVSAKDIHDKIVELLAEKDEINMIFAAAPSQNDVLKSLAEYSDIDWSRINAFHMDEYVGLTKEAPQCFSNFLMEHIFSLVPFKSINLIDCEAKDPEKECERYTELLKQYPTDIVIMGIGENGHIAFNDPGVADFNDPKWVKIATLDEVCRNQQVNDGCFSDISLVPKIALTLTCPTLVKAPYLFCIVPTDKKADAVYKTVYGEITEDCPASILRTRDNAILYLDGDSSKLLWLR